MGNMTEDSEILLWNKTDKIQLTDNNYPDSNPRINNNNQVFWASEAGFYMWENGTTTKLYDGSCYELDINDIGQAVFIPESGTPLMLWNGTEMVTVSDNAGNTQPSINNLGHVVWTSHDSHEVYFWDGQRTVIISEGDMSGDYPGINDQDQVVWRELTGGYGKLYLWNNYGQTAKYANNNLIFNNTVAENEHGIRIETAYGNRIYHNLLINNSNQSFCLQSNYWDLDYPKGGNYWSDYLGEDVFSGPGQNITGADGVGDTPYQIKGGSLQDRYPLMSKSQIPGTVIPVPTQPNPIERHTSWLPLAIGSAVALSAGLGLSLEIFGYGIMAALMALYSKIKKEEILDQYLRGKIHGYIIANPGEHYNAIKNALGLNNGALAHHLSILEKEELVKSKNDGLYKRFYPYTMNPDGATGTTHIQKLILNLMESNPGMTQKQIAARVGIHQSTVSYHVKCLQKKNLVRTERKGLSVRHYAGAGET
jgi:parallel beta-helix repeat protein